jgi:leucyl aminopeptidase
LLPAAEIPKVERKTFTEAADLDAVLAIVPVSPGRTLFEQLPHSKRWQELNARSKPGAGTVRSTVLANRRHTAAVLGYIGADATPFEWLCLAGRMMKEAGARDPEALGLIALGGADVAQADAARCGIEALLAAALVGAFRMPSFRSRAGEERAIRRIVLLGGAEVDLPYAMASARGTNLVRWLTALPPNMLNAGNYHTTIATLARENKLGFEWLDERALRRAGANAFLAVASANVTRDAGIAHLTYRPRGKKVRAPDIALVGKGIVFDTGGVNVKPHAGMLNMHIDMSGSAVALATLIALAELNAPVAVDAWLAITENNVGPNGYRPSEVITASNGVTIQVVHTDAEGRMVLADTLALAGKTAPRFMIDFATLTGIAIYSLTERMSAVLTNRPKLAPQLVAAGRASGERVWNFPFEADFDSDLESKIADVMQSKGDGKGDHLLATRFLSRFVPEGVAWAHVDLCSVMRAGGLAHVNTDITGFGVRYALELILKRNILAEVGRQ